MANIFEYKVMQELTSVQNHQQSSTVKNVWFSKVHFMVKIVRQMSAHIGFIRMLSSLVIKLRLVSPIVDSKPAPLF